MKPEYIIDNIRIYEKCLKDTKAHIFFVNQITKHIIVSYKRKLEKYDSDIEKKVLEVLIKHFESKEDYLRCEQLTKILNQEEIHEDKEYSFILS